MPFLFFFILVEWFAIRTRCCQKWSGECCYQSISVARALPSQTSLLVQSSELVAGALLSKAFADWESAIGFLSLRCREKQSLFNLEGGKLEWNKNDHHSEPFQLPFMPREFCFSSTTTSKALSSFTAAGATVLSEASSFWGFLVPGLVWCEGDSRVTEDAHPTHCYHQSYHRTPTLALRWW